MNYTEPTILQNFSKIGFNFKITQLFILKRLKFTKHYIKYRLHGITNISEFEHVNSQFQVLIQIQLINLKILK